MFIVQCHSVHSGIPQSPFWCRVITVIRSIHALHLSYFQITETTSWFRIFQVLSTDAQYLFTINSLSTFAILNIYSNVVTTNVSTSFLTM